METPDTSAGRLEAHHLQKYYGKRQVVKDITDCHREAETAKAHRG